MTSDRDIGQGLNPQAREFKLQDIGCSSLRFNSSGADPSESREPATASTQTYREVQGPQTILRIVSLSANVMLPTRYLQEDTMTFRKTLPFSRADPSPRTIPLA